MKFSDLPVGAVFQVSDGRIPESGSWRVLIKSSDRYAMIMKPDLTIPVPADFVVRDSGFKGLI